MISVKRYHDISVGHRVYGHEGACRNLHGHNYRITFECSTDELDDIGRVIDFGVIKLRLCMWLEDEWDHKFLLWMHDPAWQHLVATPEVEAFSIRAVPFNPTAENMAQYLLKQIGPEQLKGTGVKLVRVTVEETRKCSAEVSL